MLSSLYRYFNLDLTSILFVYFWCSIMSRIWVDPPVYHGTWSPGHCRICQTTLFGFDLVHGDCVGERWEFWDNTLRWLGVVILPYLFFYSQVAIPCSLNTSDITILSYEILDILDHLWFVTSFDHTATWFMLIRWILQRRVRVDNQEGC